MLFRLFAFLLGSAVFAALGGWWLREQAAWLGVAAGMASFGVTWVVLDTLRGVRVLRWLRVGDLSQKAPTTGLWGEVAVRVLRLLRSSERKLAVSEQRYADFLAAIQASPNGVVLLDAQGCIEWCNLTAAQQLGFDPVRDLRQPLTNLLRDPDFARYFHSPEDPAEPVVIAGPVASSNRVVRLALQLHRYSDQGRRLLLSRDVTALEQADTMRRDFVANVSHEIRTPLTVLSGLIETVRDIPLADTERARYLDMMAQQSQRMQTLVADLLTLSRLEGSPAPGLDEWVSGASLMVALISEAQLLSETLGEAGAAQNRHHISVVRQDALELAGAARELHSAMSNLVGNAVRYTPDGGRIDISLTHMVDGRAEFVVRDSGPGIAPEHIPRLTERFYRVDRSRSRETGGTGLGLAIVKHVAQRHAAELLIESTPGQGSRFALRLPVVRVRTQAQSDQAKSAASVY